MKTKLYSLIVFSPFSTRVGKIRMTRQMMILASAFVFSFFAAVALASIFPVSSQGIDGAERARLREETEVLRVENRNLELQTQRLEAGVSRLEGMAERITDHIEND